jgi:beta propeller repeat protein
MHTPTPLPLAARLLPPALLLAVAALLLGAAASYARVPAPTRPHDWPDFAVVTASLDQLSPAVGDGYIVWGDDRDHPLNDFDLYGYEVASGQVFSLVIAPLLQDQPATSGDWVIYRQGTNIARQYQLRAIRISTREIITIAGGAANPINADISGDYVVWQDSRNYPQPTSYDIYGYNLATNQEFTVTTAPSNQFAPRISGDIVVWQDLRNVATTGWDIYGFNLTTRQEFTVTTALGDQWQPDISGNIVAWHDYRNDINGSDIYAANLTTRQEFPVSVYTGTQESPRVASNWIVWSDSRNDPFNFDIYGYNLGTGVEHPINTLPTFQNSPDISGTLVAWQDYRNVATEADIYAANVPLDPPTATPSQTPATTATATPTRTTAASATPTPCAISFTDVPSSNPFYANIRCLACRQIVSGYADGTFRWGADVTRGQLSKIIAGAAGLSNQIPSTQQTFEDVPGSNTFWLFIERLSTVGAISGYACGGPGEPCLPGNRPYFRWGANATRGQIAKITAVTAGWNGPIPTTQQTFEDVPPGNPFWLWIEELSARNVISGYQCGGPGEPCLPGNRPYFRWGANATRGQMSKIAAQSFFPNCQTPLRALSNER